MTLLKTALLATGDEVVNGDILNTNAQAIAQQLTERGFLVGNHLVVSDQQDDIVNAIKFLLSSHAVVIITGGLGPTSDDRTRFALSQVIAKPLVFNEAVWEAIVQRLTRFNIKIHDSNRQQALFPEEAKIIANANGTAAGCYVEFADKLIFLLPGPPRECLPMLDQFVLPEMLRRFGQGSRQIFKWRLFGVIEADIAALVDAMTADYPCITGYRIDYPYLEVKIYADKNTDLTDLILQAQKVFAPYQLTASNTKASDYLLEVLHQYPDSLTIVDTATAGYLESKLAKPALRSKIYFHHAPSATPIQIQISGLAELWAASSSAAAETLLSLAFTHSGTASQQQKMLPLRNPYYTLNYAVEWLSWEIVKILAIEQ